MAVAGEEDAHFIYFLLFWLLRVFQNSSQCGVDLFQVSGVLFCKMVLDRNQRNGRKGCESKKRGQADEKSQSDFE